MSKWANWVSAGKKAWVKVITLLGDMHIPNMEKNEAAIKALKTFGCSSLDYVSKQPFGIQPTQLSHVGGINLGNNKTYDQIGFSPSGLRGRFLILVCLIFTTRYFSKIGIT
jgi:hypothetical protein